MSKAFQYYSRQPRIQHTTMSTMLETARRVEPRPTVRCVTCQLFQYVTESGKCRRCDNSLIQEEPEELVVGTISVPIVIARHGIAPYILPKVIQSKKDNSVVSIGKNVCIWRITMGWTQSDLADKSGIVRTHISRIENRRIYPGPAITAKLAAVFGITLNMLCTSEEETQILSLFSSLIIDDQRAILDRLQHLLSSVH